jgi:hypothetical protein
MIFYRCGILGAMPSQVGEVLVYACSENQYGGMHCAGLLECWCLCQRCQKGFLQNLQADKSRPKYGNF